MSTSGALNSKANGSASNPKTKPAYDPTFTDRVIAATGPEAHPRLAEIMPFLLRHLHDFAREVDLTVAEWSAAVDFVTPPPAPPPTHFPRVEKENLTRFQINAAGQMSDDKRNETQLMCDVLGLESLVDEISSSKTTSTPSAILGPFYRPNAPVLPTGSSIVAPNPSHVPSLTHFSGRVLNPRGEGIEGAVLDIWHTAPNGMYEQQDAEQPDYNLRGRFVTGPGGRFSLYCLRPTAYPVPDDGPGGRLLKLLDRSPWRPRHIHVILRAEGYESLTTQLFDAECGHLGDDSVFAVKRDLVVEFMPRQGDPGAKWTLEYDFVLSEA